MAWLSGLPELCDDARRNIHNHLYKLGRRLRHGSTIDTFKAREECIQEYLVFMHLKSKHRTPGLVGPSNVIDDVWHAHIVDTKNYRLFCNAYFGEFVDHDPNVNHGQLGRAVDGLKKYGYPVAQINTFWNDKADVEDEDEEGGCGCG